jgi:hypothetical protein
MLPFNLAFSDYEAIMLKHQIVQTTPVALDIQAIRYIGNNLLLVTLETDSLLENQFAFGMKAVIAGTDYFNGTYKIVKCDYINDTLELSISASGDNQKYVQTVAAGTITPTGTASHGVYQHSGTPLRNNDGKILAIRYANNPGIFHILYETVANKDLAIQITNTGAAQISYVVEWSITGIYADRDAMPTAMAGNIAAGDTKMLHFNHQLSGIHLFITITNGSASTYYLLAK